MKLSKSLTLWMMAFLFATVTAATPAHAAAITPAGKQELVALYITMFGRAPTTAQLAEMVTAREGGSSLVQVATTLSSDAGFALVASKDVDSFALYLANALLASDAPAEARDWAINWTVTQLQGTTTKAQVIAEAVQAMWATTNPMFTSSQTELLADVTAALAALDSPVPTAKALNDILKDLDELTEDLKIEEEDNSNDYQQAKNRIDSQKGEKGKNGKKDEPDLKDKTASPATLFKDVQDLKASLEKDGSDANREKVAKAIVTLQAKTAIWTANFGGNWTSGGTGPEHTLQMKESLTAINDRVTTNIQNTIRGATTCRTVYDSGTHTYVTRCTSS